jgi:hypothetical protein
MTAQTVSAAAVEPLTIWLCLCGSPVKVPVSRIVPDHADHESGRWCAVSRSTLAPRVLAAAGAR